MKPPRAPSAASLLTLTAIFLLGPSARADSPSAAYIFPAGGQRGTTVDVRVGGHFLHGEAPLRFHGPGIAASPTVREVETIWFEGPVIPLPDSQQAENYPRDHAAQLKLAADAPLGARLWRVWTSQGAAAAMQFIVGDLPEVVEQETDGQPIPDEVKLPVTINGRVFPREDVDAWAFDALAGQTIWCEVHAARLGSPLASRLEVLDPRGRRLAENSGYFGNDAFLTFTAPADGRYQVRIHDANFAGLQQYVYRLTLSHGPFVELPYPLGGRRGTTIQARLVGVNMPDQPLEIALPPADASGQAALFSHRVELPGGWTNPFRLETTDLVEALETEPNNEPPQAARLAAPVIANGRIDQPGDIDLWAIAARQGQALRLDLRAARLGSPLDAVLEVLDESGKSLALADDLGGGQTDCRLDFTPPADGQYLLKVRERFASRGGPRFVYRLEVNDQPQPPDFQLTLPVDALTAEREKPAKLNLAVVRRGYSGPIELAFEGLPEGVAVAPTTIPENAANIELTFTPGGQTKIGGHEVRIVGTAKLDAAEGAAPQRRVATFTIGSSASTLDPPPLDSLFLAVAIPTPFKFKGSYAIEYAGQGTTYHKNYALERNGFVGPLEVRLADRQVRHLQGVSGPTISVPAGAAEFDYAAQLPPWLEIGRTSRTILMASGEVTDFDGTRHRVSFSSGEQADQMVVIADPCPLSLTPARRSLRAVPGGEVELPIRVERGRDAPHAVTLTLAPAAHVRGVSAEPVVVPPDQSEGILRIRFAADAGPFNLPLVLRGLASHDRGRTIGQTSIEVVPAD